MAKMTDKQWKKWVAKAMKSKTKIVKPHKSIGPCSTCGRKHNKDYHRSHGKGAFQRTHG